MRADLDVPIRSNIPDDVCLQRAVNIRHCGLVSLQCVDSSDILFRCLGLNHIIVCVLVATQAGEDLQLLEVTFAWPWYETFIHTSNIAIFEIVTARLSSLVTECQTGRWLDQLLAREEADIVLPFPVTCVSFDLILGQLFSRLTFQIIKWEDFNGLLGNRFLTSSCILGLNIICLIFLSDLYFSDFIIIFKCIGSFRRFYIYFKTFFNGFT